MNRRDFLKAVLGVAVVPSVVAAAKRGPVEWERAEGQNYSEYFGVAVACRPGVCSHPEMVAELELEPGTFARYRETEALARWTDSVWREVLKSP